MGDLTRNLFRSEFACQCGCGADTVDFALATILQRTVDDFQLDLPLWRLGIEITSGVRCRMHNKVVTGKLDSKSQHVLFRAADFYLYDKNVGKHKRVNADEVADYLERRFPQNYGVGRYDGRTHFDTRTAKARWDNRR